MSSVKQRFIKSVLIPLARCKFLTITIESLKWIFHILGKYQRTQKWSETRICEIFRLFIVVSGCFCVFRNIHISRKISNNYITDHNSTTVLWEAQSYLIMPRYVMSYHNMSHHVVWCQVISYYIPCHIRSYQIMSWVLLFYTSFCYDKHGSEINEYQELSISKLLLDMKYLILSISNSILNIKYLVLNSKNC